MPRLLGIALLLLACSNEPRNQTATPPQRDRIVSIGGTVTETLYALGHGENLVGVDTSSTYPSAALDVAQVGSHHQISVEGVMALRPTRVVAIASTPPAVLEQLTLAGVAVTRIEDVTSLDRVGPRIQAIARAVGSVQRGTELAKEALDSIRSERDDGSAATVNILFVYARGSRVLSVAGKNTSADALITAAGFANAAAGLDGFAPLNAEAVVAAAPDILLMMRSGVSSLSSQGGVFDLPGISLTPAGKNRRLVEMDGLFLLGLGPRTGKALRALRSDVDRAMGEQQVL